MTATRCPLCDGPTELPVCSGCIERVREQNRCPDCDSIVTIALAARGAEVDIKTTVTHDSTCPNKARHAGR
jgi:hypothetical protein